MGLDTVNPDTVHPALQSWSWEREKDARGCSGMLPLSTPCGETAGSKRPQHDGDLDLWCSGSQLLTASCPLAGVRTVRHGSCPAQERQWKNT